MRRERGSVALRRGTSSVTSSAGDTFPIGEGFGADEQHKKTSRFWLDRRGRIAYNVGR